jgi:hypothetical protein
VRDAEHHGARPVGHPGERIQGLPDLPVHMGVESIADRRHERIQHDHRNGVLADHRLQFLVIRGQAEAHRVVFHRPDLPAVHPVEVGSGGHQPRDDGELPAVRVAIDAGLSKSEVHRLTGIARTTIDRIAGALPAMEADPR